MVRDTVVNKLNEHEVNDQEYRIYTTLDPDLQRAAASRRNRNQTRRRSGHEDAHPQDQGRRQAGNHRRARVRRRKWHSSPWIRIPAKSSARRRTKLRNQPVESRARQAPHWLHLQTVRLCRRHEYRHRRLDHRDHPGSIVPISLDFLYGDQIYEPRNYKEEYHGDVTLRYALAMSLNNATVKWRKKWAMTKSRIWPAPPESPRSKATPAMALGAYDATPLT